MGEQGNARKARSRLRVQAILIRHELAVLEVAPQNPEVHRPAARDAIVLVETWPAGVMEADEGEAISVIQVKAGTGTDPVGVGPGHLQLKLERRGAPRDRGPPIILRPEP